MLIENWKNIPTAAILQTNVHTTLVHCMHREENVWMNIPQLLQSPLSISKNVGLKYWLKFYRDSAKMQRLYWRN